MSKKDINVVIMDSSYILCEGLSAIISKLNKNINIHLVDDLNSLKLLNIRTQTDIVFVNPLLIINKTKEFLSLKKDLNYTIWVGIINNMYDQQVLSMFDDSIYSNDSSDKIHNILNSLFSNKLDKNEARSQKETLSDRENEVLKLLAKGDSNKEIADKLNISTNTIITHRKNITQKTGIKSLSGLTIYAVVNGIVSIDDYSSVR